MTKSPIYGMTLAELQDVAAQLGLPKFTAKQIADWLYKKNVSSIDEMTNLSKKARELLNEKFTFGLVPPVKETVSIDGTKKYLFSVLEGR